MATSDDKKPPLKRGRLELQAETQAARIQAGLGPKVPPRLPRGSETIRQLVPVRATLEPVMQVAEELAPVHVGAGTGRDLGAVSEAARANAVFEKQHPPAPVGLLSSTQQNPNLQAADRRLAATAREQVDLADAADAIRLHPDDEAEDDTVVRDVPES